MPVDWTDLFRRFKGMWLALADDEQTVLGSGKSAREALEQARARGVSTPILTHMPDRLEPYIGSGLL